jgi:hypothetical protein
MRWLVAGISAVLALILYAEWYVTPVEPPVPRPASGSGDKAVAPQPVGAGRTFAIPLPDRDAFDVIAQRPLFSNTRRPPEEDEQAEPEPEVVTEGVEGLDLNAVIMTSDEIVALVRDTKSGDLQRVKAGEQVRGWQVESIERGQLLLKLGDRTATIVLREFAPVAPAPPPKKSSLQEQRRQRALRLRAQRQNLQDRAKQNK